MQSVKHKVGNLEIGSARRENEWWHVYVKGPKEKIRFYVAGGTESKAAALTTILADLIRNCHDEHKHRWVSYIPKDRRLRKDATWFKCHCKAVTCIPDKVGGSRD